MSYEPEIPPSSLPDDAQAYLAREFDRIQTTLNEKTQAGTAGLELDFNTALPGPITITGTPTKVTGFNAKNLNEVGAFANLPNDTLLIQEVGNWVFAAQYIADITASTANASREVSLQLYSEQDAAPFDRVAQQTIPRYGASINLVGTAKQSVTLNGLNKDYALYIFSPSNDTITVNAIYILDYFIHRVTP